MGRTNSERPHATGQWQCVIVQKDPDSQGGSAGRAPKPAPGPAKVGLHGTWVCPDEQTGTAQLEDQARIERALAAVCCQRTVHREKHCTRVRVRVRLRPVVPGLRLSLPEPGEASLLAAFGGLRDLLWYLLAIASMKTRRPQERQRRPRGDSSRAQQTQQGRRLSVRGLHRGVVQSLET